MSGAELVGVGEQCHWDSPPGTRPTGAGRLGTFPGRHLLHVLRWQRSNGNAEEQEEIGTIPRLSRGPARALSCGTWRQGVEHKQRDLRVCRQVHDELCGLQCAQRRTAGNCRRPGLPRLNLRVGHRTTAAGQNPRISDPGATATSLGLLLSCVILVGVVGRALIALITGSSGK